MFKELKKKIMVSSIVYNIIVVCETWLDRTLPDHNTIIRIYKIFRKDRDHAKKHI